MTTPDKQPGDGGAAFPHTQVTVHNRDGSEASVMAPEGMSLRDWFAGKAPADEIDDMASYSQKDCAEVLGIEKYLWPRDYPRLLAVLRYRWADAMLAQRKARTP